MPEDPQEEAGQQGAVLTAHVGQSVNDVELLLQDHLRGTRGVFFFVISGETQSGRKANAEESKIGADLFELAVLLFGHDLLHRVAGAHAQGARLDALEGHVGAEGEPLVDHLALLQAVQQAAHEHWREESGGREVLTRGGKNRWQTNSKHDGEPLGALTDVAFFALFGFVAQADFESVDFTGQVTERTGGGWGCEVGSRQG